MKAISAIIVSVIAASQLAACKGVQVTPQSPEMPKPLIVPFPADVGVHYTEALRQYVHEEERWGSRWRVSLGESHVALMKRIMQVAFRRVVEVKDPKTLPPDSALGVVLQPHIDRFSFITPRDSGGDFFAVTIKYRLEVFAPDGRLADTLTFTGYGGARSKGLSSSRPLRAATQAAMRDAAAKFLVQFPEQKVAQQLRAGEPLINEKPPQATGAAQGEEITIDAVPIIDQPGPEIPVTAPSPPEPPADATPPEPSPSAEPPSTEQSPSELPAETPPAEPSPVSEPPSAEPSSTERRPPSSDDPALRSDLFS